MEVDMRIKNRLFVLMVLVSGFAFAEPGLKVKTDLVREFGEEKAHVVRTATLIGVIQLSKSHVWKCAHENSWRGKPLASGEKFVRELWFDPKLDRKIVSYIHLLPPEPEAIGRGTLRTLLSFGGNSQIRIWISDRIIPERDTSEEMNQLLDTVVHEIGHNIGLNHGPDFDYEDNYKGYFVEALGMCARGDGKFPGWPAGLSLDGRNVRR
jgi:hypothetical protein